MFSCYTSAGIRWRKRIFGYGNRVRISKHGGIVTNHTHSCERRCFSDSLSSKRTFAVSDVKCWHVLRDLMTCKLYQLPTTQRTANRMSCVACSATATICPAPCKWWFEQPASALSLEVIAHVKAGIRAPSVY